jgi:hypothetical protein|tara:strand:+ start:944 stop:1099 length:156 start_codon:yes stop_codon:yes gene_type:complete
MLGWIGGIGIIGAIFGTIIFLVRTASEGIAEFLGTIVGIWIFFSFISWLIG